MQNGLVTTKECYCSSIYSTPVHHDRATNNERCSKYNHQCLEISSRHDQASNYRTDKHTNGIRHIVQCVNYLIYTVSTCILFVCWSNVTLSVCCTTL